MASKKLTSLKDLFEHEIRDLYSAESQLSNALPKMAEKAHDEKLRRAFEDHLEETRRQKDRLEKIGQICNFEVKGEKCEAMEGLVREGEEMLNLDAEGDVKDAGLIAAAQRAEHYEISGYGTARNYAKRLGLNECADLLEETLQEEKGADAKLNDIAIDRVNDKAQR